MAFGGNRTRASSGPEGTHGPGEEVTEPSRGEPALTAVIHFLVVKRAVHDASHAVRDRRDREVGEKEQRRSNGAPDALRAAQPPEKPMSKIDVHARDLDSAPNASRKVRAVHRERNREQHACNHVENVVVAQVDRRKRHAHGERDGAPAQRAAERKYHPGDEGRVRAVERRHRPRTRSRSSRRSSRRAASPRVNRGAQAPPGSRPRRAPQDRGRTGRRTRAAQPGTRARGSSRRDS